MSEVTPLALSCPPPGLLVSLRTCGAPQGNLIFDDGPWWSTPGDFTQDVENSYPDPVNAPDQARLIRDEGHTAGDI